MQHQCIKNLTHVLEAAGTTIDKVVKVNVFLSDMDNFADMNSVYMQYWGDVKPCRTYVIPVMCINVLCYLEADALYP
jgi:enamine deaminase RidA (YjgF/YER057c/UK114 family)